MLPSEEILIIPQHIVSHQHRKFALTDSNWTDLDKLLAHLGRRLKEPDDDDDF